MDTYQAGALAFVDSFAGLLPCKVIAVCDDGQIVVKFTAQRPGISVAEHAWERADHVVPRDKVRQRNGRVRIRTDFTWEVSGEVPDKAANIKWERVSAPWLVEVRR